MIFHQQEKLSTPTIVFHDSITPVKRQLVKTILVVDDELANAEVLSFILAEEGYRVFTASNGQHGLERIHEVQPDLVLVDFMMPIMNGAAMVHAMREAPAMRHIKIMMHSSLSEPVIRQHVVDYDAFLRKPYNLDFALRSIHELIGEDPDVTLSSAVSPLTS